MEHPFTTYVRTKSVFQRRLKDLKSYDNVKVYMYELTKLGVSGALLYSLKSNGELWYDEDGNFKAVRDGPIDPKLLEKTRKWGRSKAPLTTLHEYMKKQLNDVTINVPRDDLPVYFKAFVDHRKDDMSMFFTVDGFSGRVHTPVVNLKGELRQSLRLGGKALCSLDVKQMQPTILAKVLEANVGKNPFSDSIFSGEDVYVLLLQQNKTLEKRSDAKKFLYQLIFGKPMDDIGRIFSGDTRWVDWVNMYKSNLDGRNPHARDRHTNLAWLLQTKEVEVMSGIWRQLMDKQIPFLTIHDDVLCQRQDKDTVYQVFDTELKKHFRTFEITVNCYD